VQPVRVSGHGIPKHTKNHGKTMGKPWENGDLCGKSPFLIGKPTISMGH